MRLRRAYFLAAILGMVLGCGDVRYKTGDRVLVSKCAYESGLTAPRRFDVVVFKYPERPTKGGSPYNYIKRLMGLPGEVLAILFGRLFVFTPEPGEAPPYDDSQEKSTRLWESQFTHYHDEKGPQLFFSGRMQIVRKAPDVMLAMRRPVFINNHQPTDLADKIDPRWKPARDTGWKTQDSIRFAFNNAGKDVQWLRYQHLVVYRMENLTNPKVVEMFEDQSSRPTNLPANLGQFPALVLLQPGKIKPQLITDSMSYNSNDPGSAPSPHWVGDLMLECKLDVRKKQGAFWMELSKGPNRYRARFDLATGDCELFQATGAEVKSLGTKTTAVAGPGIYTIRFANVDARLTVWVNGKLPFEDGVSYPPPEMPDEAEGKSFAKGDLPLDALEKKLAERRGPTVNDLEPASLGASGAEVEVTNLEIWRDTYYIASRSNGPTEPKVPDVFVPANCGELKTMHPLTFYVQPGHYFCMGDNSPASADSRDWGTVPARLMLGRALMIYWPLNRAGFIE